MTNTTENNYATLEDVRKWIESGSAVLFPGILREDKYRGKHIISYIKISDNIAYLYEQEYHQCFDYDNILTLSWGNELSFAGIYCFSDRKFYLVKDRLRSCFPEDDADMATRRFGKLHTAFIEAVRNKVESIVNNNKANLSISNLKDSSLLYSLSAYHDHKADKIIREDFSNRKELACYQPKYRCEYSISPTNFSSRLLEYIETPEKMVEKEASAYLEKNQERILYELLKNEELAKARDKFLSDSNSEESEEIVVSERLIHVAETNVDGCGGIADEYVEFECDLYKSHVETFNNLLMEAKRQLQDEDAETVDFIEKALEDFYEQTGIHGKIVDSPADFYIEF